MDLHQLRVFASVYRNRSFSRASEELFLTQPTVSDHIKSLEAELDVRLFDRLGRSIIPTGEADLLYTHAAELLEKAREIMETVSRFSKKISGELVIGASTIPGTFVLPYLMVSCQKDLPSITFQIRVSDTKEIVDRIASYELLLGIVGSEIPHDQISFEPFMEDELIAVAAPSLGNAAATSLSRLMSLPMVLREEGSGTRKEVERMLRENGLSVDRMKIAGIFGSSDAVREAVKAGLGVAMVSRISVADELKYGSLKELQLREGPFKRNFYIALHRKRSLPFIYSTFIDYLKQHRQ